MHCFSHWLLLLLLALPVFCMNSKECDKETFAKSIMHLKQIFKLALHLVFIYVHF